VSDQRAYALSETTAGYVKELIRDMDNVDTSTPSARNGIQPRQIAVVTPTEDSAEFDDGRRIYTCDILQFNMTESSTASLDESARCMSAIQIGLQIGVPYLAFRNGYHDGKALFITEGKSLVVMVRKTQEGTSQGEYKFYDAESGSMIGGGECTIFDPNESGGG
jgi:hypothetical protein